jgi:hypothetical protein
MDSEVLLAGLLGAALGAAICRQLMKREPWAASGSAAIGGAGLLLLATEGNRSHVEHVIVFVVELALWLYFVMAIASRKRRSADSRQ